MTKVPRNFHFVFGLRPQTEPFHFAYYLCIASCIAVNKPDAVYFHYKHLPYGEWWERISELLILNLVEEDTFISNYNYKDKEIETFRYAHLADIIRLEMLIKFGGIYADIDTIFVNRIPDEFYQMHCVLGKEKVEWREAAAKQAGGSLCNAWILAEKGSTFIKLWLQQMYKEFDGSWSSHSTFLPYKLSVQNPELIHVEPERSFFYFDWTKKGINNIFIKNIKDLNGVYSIHLWSHLWWDVNRTDFSYFHNKRITPNYVAFSKTTYGSISKRFLPKDIRTSKSKYVKERLRSILENALLYFGLTL